MVDLVNRYFGGSWQISILAGKNPHKDPPTVTLQNAIGFNFNQHNFHKARKELFRSQYGLVDGQRYEGDGLPSIIRIRDAESAKVLFQYLKEHGAEKSVSLNVDEKLFERNLFDRVPSEALERCLEQYGINADTLSLCKPVESAPQKELFAAIEAHVSEKSTGVRR